MMGLHILPHLPCCGIPELLSSRSFREAVPPDPESRPFPSGQVPQLAHPVQVPLDAWQESLRSPHAFSALLRVQMETDDNISPGIRLTAMPLLPVPRILLLNTPLRLIAAIKSWSLSGRPWSISGFASPRQFMAT